MRYKWVYKNVEIIRSTNQEKNIEDQYRIIEEMKKDGWQHRGLYLFDVESKKAKLKFRKFVPDESKKAEFSYSDGGLGTTGINEKNDCTVRAISLVTEKPYEEIHALLKKYGRVEGKAFAFQKHMHKIKYTLKIKLKSVKRKGSLEKLIKQYPKGKLLVHVSRHAFAVIDGVVKDIGPQSLGRHIKQAWLLVE